MRGNLNPSPESSRKMSDSESFHCLFDALSDAGFYKFLNQGPNRRLIWALCAMQCSCMTCHNRLAFKKDRQLDPQEKAHAQTRFEKYPNSAPTPH